MTNHEREQILINDIPKEEKEKYQASTESMSAKTRRLIEACNKVEEDLELEDDMEKMNAIILRTYRNAIEQNIQVLKGQIDKIDEELEQYESDEEDSDVILEIDLDLRTHNL